MSLIDRVLDMDNLAGQRLTYQQCFELQAQGLRKVIEGTLPAYRPMVVR